MIFMNSMHVLKYHTVPLSIKLLSNTNILKNPTDDPNCRDSEERLNYFREKTRINILKINSI